MADLLLVDNDARLTELLAWFLEKRGHSVRTAVSYAEARDRIAERKPELMLADLELGRERGCEEMQSMDRAGTLPRTLVVSGYLDSDTERSLADLPPVVGALRKPFDLDRLEETIRSSVAKLDAAPIQGGDRRTELASSSARDTTSSVRDTTSSARAASNSAGATTNNFRAKNGGEPA